MKKGVLFLLSGLSLGWSAYFCSDTGLYYSDQAFCNSVCSNPCEVFLTNDQGLTCDTQNYELFIYNPQTNKTIAITKNSDSWDQFSNLLVIEDASDNEAGKQILSYLNTTAWIGLHDPNLSPSYNSVNPSRFVWWDGTPVSYTNWNTGEPDNRVDTQDIGNVSPLGEHWAYMDAGGTWNDDGLHLSYGGDYKPRKRALVMWRQQLDCVNGLPQNDQTTTNDMISLYCNGQTPCYLCTDGTDIQACGLGDAFVGSYELKGSGQLLEVSFASPLSGTVSIRATGLVDYCNGRCPRYDGQALVSWIVFRGNDGNYYWLGNPDSSPVCMGNLQLQVLSYTTDGNGNIVLNIPQGLQLVSVVDVESLSGQCTGDNTLNLSLTFLSGDKDWLCPIQNNCQCPEGSEWDNNLKKCVKTPEYTCSSAFYSFNSADTLCVASPSCSGGTYDSTDNRCELPPTPVCPSGSSYDPSLDVCYTSAVCDSGYALDIQDDRCEIPATVTCRRGSFNQQSGKCEFSPECPPGSTLVNGRCEKEPQTACGLGSYDSVDKRFEWSPVCPSGMTFNGALDRCEYVPSCKFGSVGGSGLCEVDVEWICSPGYTYDPASHQCIYVERISATPNCPPGYTFDANTGMCSADPEWNCKISKSGCVSPPQMFSCVGGDCSAGGFSFGQGCEVNTDCGLLNPGDSCTDTNTGCSYTNLSVQVCPDGSVSPTCEVSPSYSCPDGYVLNGTVCERTFTETPIPSCPLGYTYDENLGVCTGAPDCGEGSYDRNSQTCWINITQVGCGSASYDPSQDVCWTTFFFTCDEGWSFDTEKRVCFTSPTCPEGVLVNGICQIAPDTNCGSNSFDATQMVCYSVPQCGGLMNYSGSRDRCEKQAGRTCSTGTYDSLQDVCAFEPSCFDGGTFNAQQDRCEMAPQMGCESPFVLNEDQGLCTTDRICEGMTACTVSETCPGGGTWDANAGVCYSSADPVCPAGGGYDPALRSCIATAQVSVKDVVLLQGRFGGKQTCVDTDPLRGSACGKRNTGTVSLVKGSSVTLKWSTCCVCDDDYGRLEINVSGLDAGGNQYSYTYSKYCPGGGTKFLTDNSGTSISYDVAYYDTWGWDGAKVWLEIKEKTCPDGFSYDSENNRCFAEPSWTCRDPSYTYNPQTGRCESPLDISMTCPLDPSLPCIQHADGNYYCSPNQCLDATQYPPVNTDTQQGANDIPADGEITEQGCLGTVYIFNGRDMRCRPPGTQTGFSNCCKKTKTWFGLGRCNETEQALAKLRSWGKLDGNCHYVGEYCAEWWEAGPVKTCVQKKRTYCCFSSPLARIIHEQGRPQLGIGWGTPESPNCRGFTMQEFQKLDFSKMDFSEWVEEEVSRNIAPQIQTNIQNVINQIPSQLQNQ